MDSFLPLSEMASLGGAGGDSRGPHMKDAMVLLLSSTAEFLASRLDTEERLDSWRQSDWTQRTPVLLDTCLSSLGLPTGLSGTTAGRLSPAHTLSYCSLLPPSPGGSWGSRQVDSLGAGDFLGTTVSQVTYQVMVLPPPYSRCLPLEGRHQVCLVSAVPGQDILPPHS